MSTRLIRIKQTAINILKTLSHETDRPISEIISAMVLYMLNTNQIASFLEQEYHIKKDYAEKIEKQLKNLA